MGYRGGGQHLATPRLRRDPGGKVDRRPEDVAGPLHHGTVVEPRPGDGEARLGEGDLEQPGHRPHACGRVGERVADRFHEPSLTGQRRSGQLEEAVEQIDRFLVAVRLGECAEPGEVDEGDRTLLGGGLLHGAEWYSEG